ncbi:unnamed protein product [Trifolium pratense]|uniref:Uncharacterized protein n=1 Tax=Trifolium pratense TaxID=57577 RepID=A0ACB0IQX7_TRIPR|nr:unnamed protein product [Trifolium pratense]
MDPVNIGLGCSEKTIPVTSSSIKPKKKTMTSVYLKFFETATDGKTRRCKFCGQTYSIATATGNLGRHLANRHPGYDKEGEAVSNLVTRPNGVVIKKFQARGKSNQVDYDHLNWLLVRWLVLASLPPSTLEEKWLVNSYKFLNPSIQIWPSDKYRTVLDEVFSSMREDVRALLEQVSFKFSITLDFWTSFEQNFYMSVTCQWIDEDWCFEKLLLDVCRIPYPCGGAEIYRCLIKVLKFYNIESRILSCTHDNSSSAMHACHTLKEDFDGQKIGPFCYIPCAAQTLNLIIDDGLRSGKQVISKIREFAMELNASPVINDDFIQISTAYQEGTWKFPLDVSARWSGNYQMLDLVRKAGKSVDAIIRKYEETLGRRILLSPSDKSVVNIMHQYLEPFYKTTNDICTSKVPTIGLVLFFMDHISETIATCKESRPSPEWLKSAAEEMAKKARNYTNQVCNIFTYMTAILDPRIKGDLIPDSLNSQSYLEEARSHFLRNYSINHFSSLSSGYNGQEIEDGGNVSFAEEIARKKRRTNMSSATDELTQYLSEAPAPIATDVLEWWKNDSTQAVLCIKSWIQVGIKFKYKSTEIDYERLMELAAASATHNNSLSNSEKKQK